MTKIYFIEPLQLFLHSTNLYKTHDHQNKEAHQEYLTCVLKMLN